MKRGEKRGDMKKGEKRSDEIEVPEILPPTDDAVFGKLGKLKN
jgi:hypothetical protein